MNRTLVAALPLLVCATLFACSSEPLGSSDQGSGAQPDRTVNSSVLADAGEPDAGVPDAGAADAGPCSNGAPTAVILGPNGETNSMVTDLDAGSIQLDGTQSCGAVKWTFYLYHKPYGADSAELDGAGVTSTNPSALLTPAPGITGEYGVALVVRDATGRASDAATFRILVNP